MRSALTPVVSQLGIDVGILLGGVAVVENVFSLGDIGQDSVQAIDQGNLPVIIGFVLAAAVFVVAANTVVDVAGTLLGPGSGSPEPVARSPLRNALARPSCRHDLSVPRSIRVWPTPLVPGSRRTAMRKYLILSVLGVCLLVLMPGTTAFAGNSTYYAGKNSQGQKLFFSVDQTARGPRFDPFFTNMVARCPVTGDVIQVGFSFGGFRIPIKNGRFHLRFNDLTDLFTWSGTITPKKATGKESFDLAAFDNQKGLQDCTTGSLSWTAQALVPATTKAAAPRASYRVSITKAADGSVHFSVTH